MPTPSSPAFCALVDAPARSSAPVAAESGPGGLPFVQLYNDHGHASVCLIGAQVVQWHARGQSAPVLWVSSAAHYGPGKRIRGGVPVCWPWFGRHPVDATLPSHGLARNLPWRALRRDELAGGCTRLVLELPPESVGVGPWPQGFALELAVVLGPRLGLFLTTRNTGPAAFAYSEALHTYFQIGDIGDVRVEGLQDVEYLDALQDFRRLRQEGAVSFAGEVDRVFQGTPPECAIVDPGLGRRIVVQTHGSASTIVWNPWADKGQRLGDLGQAADGRPGWREMLCVESGNALEHAIGLEPGLAHCLAVEYAVEAL